MSAIPHDIRIDVQTTYIHAQSNPAEHRYVFAYTVTIRNHGTTPAKLLNRHWIITDADGKIQEVRGRGVVGEQPYLPPGQGFQYTSAAMVATPFATMHGSYEMLADTGEKFDATIPLFRLALPHTLH